MNDKINLHLLVSLGYIKVYTSTKGSALGQNDAPALLSNAYFSDANNIARYKIK